LSRHREGVVLRAGNRNHRDTTNHTLAVTINRHLSDI
jgi:hypothetical protein